MFFLRKMGKLMAEEGWIPKLPIILVPGASSLRFGQIFFIF